MVDHFVKQLDGCKLCGGRVTGGMNCTCASHAMWLYRASQGNISTTGCHVRDLTNDCVGGTRLEQMNPVSSHFGIPQGTMFRPGTFAKMRQLLISLRFGSHLQVGYSALAGTEWDCFSNGFRGNHDLYIRGGDANHAWYGDPGADGRRGNIPDGWQSIPWDLLERAAGRLELNPGGPTLAQEQGSGYVYALLTPPDPIQVHKKYTVAIAGRTGTVSTYTPLYNRINGTKVGSVSRASYIVEQWNVNSIWWYKIKTKADGSYTGNKDKFFKPNRYMTFKVV